MRSFSLRSVNLTEKISLQHCKDSFSFLVDFIYISLLRYHRFVGLQWKSIIQFLTENCLFLYLLFLFLGSQLIAYVQYTKTTNIVQ